jgi:hypothetical protein
MLTAMWRKGLEKLPDIIIGKHPGSRFEVLAWCRLRLCRENAAYHTGAD